MDLQRVVPALLRSAWTLLLAAVAAFVVAALVTALRPDVYEAQALVDVELLLDDEGAFTNAERADRTVANELVLAGDQRVAELAGERLEGVDVADLRDDVAIDQLTGTDNIRFTAAAAVPDTAARTATAYAEAYAAARLEQRQAVVSEEAEVIAGELAALQTELDTLSGSLTTQDRSREQALRDQYDALVGRQVELRTSTRTDAGPVRSVLPAPVPDGPAGAGPLPLGLLAGLLTLALGAVIVAVRSRTRDAVEFRSDLQDIGLPVVAETDPARRPSPLSRHRRCARRGRRHGVVRAHRDRADAEGRRTGSHRGAVRRRPRPRCLRAGLRERTPRAGRRGCSRQRHGGQPPPEPVAGADDDNRRCQPADQRHRADKGRGVRRCPTVRRSPGDHSPIRPVQDTAATRGRVHEPSLRRTDRRRALAARRQGGGADHHLGQAPARGYLSNARRSGSPDVVTGRCTAHE